MPYITHTELAERPGACELGRLAAPENVLPIDYTLMDATLRGLDRTAWSPQDVADADAALRRIDEAVAEADATIDGYLAKRGYALPLQFAASSAKLISGWSRAIAHYLLSKVSIGDEKTSPIARDWREALRMLQLLADGKFSLGADDPQSAGQGGGATDVRFAYPAPVFGRDQLKAFR